MKKKKIIYAVLTVTMLASFSCKKFATVDPVDNVLVENSLKTTNDAITNMYGLYSLMQPLVDQLFLAGEAQGDLVVPARGADQYIREIAQNRVTSSNPYTDYSKFYKLVIACNQAIKNFAELAKIDPVYNTNTYKLNVAEATYIKAWAYLQIVKIWGDVPYVEDGAITADQIKSLPVVSGNLILQEMAKACQANVATMDLLSTAGFNGTDGTLVASQFTDRNARILLAEIYTYLDDFTNAWATINKYYIGFESDGADKTKNEASYNMLASSLQWWDVAFSKRDGNRYLTNVALAVHFSGTRNQFNSLIKWTGNKNGAIYALKPSSNAINGWKTTPLILQQYQTTAQGWFVNPTYNFGENNGQSGDARSSDGKFVIGHYGDYWRGEGGSYFVSGTDTLIFKYLMKNHAIEKVYSANDAGSNNDTNYPLYRDGTLCLLISEILNNMGMSTQALNYFNGINNYAYFFHGSRYRVGVYPLRIDPAGGDVKTQVDKLILQEGALELAFEGRRWFDLVRFAKRHPEDPNFLGRIVAQKYPASERDGIMDRLRKPTTWYFPVYKGNVASN